MFWVSKWVTLWYYEMHRLLRAFDHNHTEKARYKFLIIIKTKYMYI